MAVGSMRRVWAYRSLWCIVLVVSIAALQGTSAFPARPYRRTYASERLAAKHSNLPPPSDAELVGWATSRVDHFSADDRTFQQRYFINTTLYMQGSPVFLCIGGEGPPLTENVVVTGEEHCALMVHLAVQHSALILALEHRYYGQSQPFPDLSTPNLRFLSSRQALQDIALFHEYITSRLDLPATTKWVTFGGSYPGMLAAWSRSKFPHLFHAAVSSSAPVEAVLNMQGYNDVTASSLADAMVGGSRECVAAVRAGFADVGDRISTAAGRRELEKDFNVCNASSSSPILEDVRSQALFTEGAADPLIPQSNDPACTSPLCDIRRQCELMSNTSIGTAYERLVELNRVARGGECLAADYQAMLAQLVNPSLAPDRTDRVWFYQTCTEFGFYQTCDADSDCAFTSRPHLNSVESYTALCESAYGISASAVARLIDETNAVYGGRNLPATRILWINGLIDPWRAQAVTKAAEGKEGRLSPVLLVPGASHHFWTHPALPTDSPYVVKARLQIGEFVAKALADKESRGEGARKVEGNKGQARLGDHYVHMSAQQRLPGVPLAPLHNIEALF